MDKNATNFPNGIYNKKIAAEKSKTRVSGESSISYPFGCDFSIVNKVSVSLDNPSGNWLFDWSFDIYKN